MVVHLYDINISALGVNLYGSGCVFVYECSRVRDVFRCAGCSVSQVVSSINFVASYSDFRWEYSAVYYLSVLIFWFSCAVFDS